MVAIWALLAISYYVTSDTEPPLFEVVDVDADQRISLTMGIIDPDISPDNKRIAFAQYNFDGSGMIATMAVDGSDIRSSTDLPGREYVPRWSPDGRQIAFISNPQPGTTQLWVMRADLQYPRRLSTGSFVRNHVWSPDGSAITFDDGERIWLVDPETAEVRSLTPPGARGFPAWSGDGSRLLFGSANGLRVVNLDGTVIADIATHGLFEEIGSLSPDGNRVAFVGLVDETYAIHVIDLLSAQTMKVSPVGGTLPVWRP